MIHILLELFTIFLLYFIVYAFMIVPTFPAFAFLHPAPPQGAPWVILIPTLFSVSLGHTYVFFG